MALIRTLMIHHFVDRAREVQKGFEEFVGVLKAGMPEIWVVDSTVCFWGAFLFFDTTTFLFGCFC